MSRSTAVEAERAARARVRQLDYMRRFAEKWRGREADLTASMARKARGVRARIEAIRPVRPNDRVLEVGSGGCGIIFNFGPEDCLGIDPLADDLPQLFSWQHTSAVASLQAEGEKLPFDDASFDIVMSDNVVDHAEDPRRIVEEIADHTVHLTPATARELLAGLSLRIVQESIDMEAARKKAKETPPRHQGDSLKRLFFKNATWEVFALRDRA